MGWARHDDRRHNHPKLRSAGLAAAGLDANAITFCSQNETDGFVPVEQLAAIAWGDRNAKKLAALLVSVGRWEPAPGGWNVHDYLEYHKSHAVLEAEREAEKLKKRKQREKAGRGSDGRYASPWDNTDCPPGTPPGSPGGCPPVPTPPHPESSQPPTNFLWWDAPEWARAEVERQYGLNFAKVRHPPAWKAACLQRVLADGPDAIPAPKVAPPSTPENHPHLAAMAERLAERNAHADG